jgi:AraC-like DNA-binding protein
MHTPTGALRLKEPGERFSTEQVDAPTSLAILQLDPARLAELLDALPASRRHFGELQLEQGAHALPRLRALMGRLRATDAALLDREEALAELIQDFFAPNMEAVAPGTRARPTRAMRRVRDYIEAHYEESFSLGTLAQLCGLHEVYLVRAFRQCYGLPPHALQNELRIQAARRALTSGAHGATLAAQLGFHDQSHFIRHFKRIVGVTPGEYARAG